MMRIFYYNKYNTMYNYNKMLENEFDNMYSPTCNECLIPCICVIQIKHQQIRHYLCAEL